MAESDSNYFDGASAEEVTSAISDLLQSPPGTGQEARWMEDFNHAAIGWEGQESRDDCDVELPPPTLSWKAEVMWGELHIISPPICRGKYAVRLCVDVQHPVRETHIKTIAIPWDGEDRIEKAFRPCLTTGAPDLPSIFAVWDWVARVGVDESVSKGIITGGWVDNVFGMAEANCAMDDPARYLRGHGWRHNVFYIRRHKNNAKLNNEIREVERLCAVRGFTRRELEGDGLSWFARTDASYRNDFISKYELNTAMRCTACNITFQPRRYYPRHHGMMYYVPHLHENKTAARKHLKTINHELNAAIFLLKMRGQGAK